MDRPGHETIEEACNELMWAMQKYRDEPTEDNQDDMAEKLRDVRILADHLVPEDDDAR